MFAVILSIDLKFKRREICDSDYAAEVVGLQYRVALCEDSVVRGERTVG
jgi:hypothetical protein